MLFCYHLNAQSKSNSLTGKIYVENHHLAEVAMVAIVNSRDSVAVTTVYTDRNGVFGVNNIKSGEYFLRVSKVNYVIYRSANFVVGPATNINFDITLKPTNTSLKEVVITNRKAFIESRADKTILNVAKAVATTGTSILDVLAAAPGIKVSSDDVISYRSGQPPLVLINGKAINLPQHEVELMLRNMSSADVESVELVSNPSARYDAAGTGGLINIVTKKGLEQGLNGSLSAGYDQGKYARENSGLNFNYRKSKLNLFGSLQLSNNKSERNIITDRGVGNASLFNTRYSTTLGVVSPSFRLGIDYNIDPSHTIGVLFNGFTNIIDLTKNTNSAISNLGRADSILQTGSDMSRNIRLANYNFNYTGKLGHSKQTISVDADYSKYHRSSDEMLSAMLTDINLPGNNTFANYLNSATTNYHIFSGKTDYLNNFKNAKLEAGAKFSYVRSDNRQMFDSIAGNTTVRNDILSSVFRYVDNTAAIYATYSGHNTANKLNYILGARFERRTTDANLISSNQSLNRVYNNLYPQLQFNYQFNADHKISLDVSRRTDQPLYEDLNPILAYQDHYTYRLGNPYLQPAYKNAVQLTHVYKERFFTSIGYSHIANFFGYTAFLQNDSSKIYITTKLNLKSMSTYELTFNTSVAPVSWWNINFDADVMYQRFVDYFGALNKGTFDAIFKVNQQMALPGGVAVNIFGTYEVPTDYAIYHYRATYYVKAGLTKKVINKRGTIALALDDIFNTRRDRYSSDYINLNMVGYDKKETRVASVSFTWQFGKSSVKAARKHMSSNTDEQKRIGAAQ